MIDRCGDGLHTVIPLHVRLRTFMSASRGNNERKSASRDAVDAARRRLADSWRVVPEILERVADGLIMAMVTVAERGDGPAVFVGDVIFSFHDPTLDLTRAQDLADKIAEVGGQVKEILPVTQAVAVHCRAAVLIEALAENSTLRVEHDLEVELESREQSDI